MNSIHSYEQELEYGDTFALFGRTKIFLDVPVWDKILKCLGKKGVTGEDVLMGNYITTSGYKIMGIRNSIGFHLGTNSFSYWNTFLASDALRELEFPELYKGKKTL